MGYYLIPLRRLDQVETSNKFCDDVLVSRRRRQSRENVNGTTFALAQIGKFFDQIHSIFEIVSFREFNRRASDCLPLLWSRQVARNGEFRRREGTTRCRSSEGTHRRSRSTDTKVCLCGSLHTTARFFGSGKFAACLDNARIRWQDSPRRAPARGAAENPDGDGARARPE